MAIRSRTSPQTRTASPAAPSMVGGSDVVGDPNLVEHDGVDSDGDGIEDVDETDSDGDGTADVDEPDEAAKPWVGYRDPKVPLSVEDNAAILAHDDRIVSYNTARRVAGLSEALTKEEQDRVP